MKCSNDNNAESCHKCAPGSASRCRRLFRFCLRWLKRGIILLICLVSLGALFWSVENWRGARAWKQALDQLDRDDPGWRDAPPPPSPVPPEEEAFNHPVFAAYFGKPGIGPASITGFTRDSWWKDLEWLWPKTGPLRERNLPPLEKLYLPSGYPDLNAWNQVASEHFHTPEQSPGQTFPALRYALSRSDRLLSAVHEAISRPCLGSSGYGGDDGMILRRCLKLFQLRMTLALRDNQLSGVLSDWEAICQLQWRAHSDSAAAIFLEARIQQQLNAFTLPVIAAHSFNEEGFRAFSAMNRRYEAFGKTNDADIGHIMRSARRHIAEFMTFAADSTQAARDWRKSMGYKIRSPQGILASMLINGAIREEAMPEQFFWRMPMPSGWYNQVGLDILRGSSDRIKRWESVKSAADRRVELIAAFRPQIVDTWYRRQITRNHVWDGEDEYPWGVRVYHTAATARLIRTALLCATHRCAQGAWPESLDSLSPDLRAQVPLCPVNEVPPAVRPAADGGLLLWYPGLDGDDDGGKAAEHPLVKDGSAYSAADGDWCIAIPPSVKPDR